MVVDGGGWESVHGDIYHGRFSTWFNSGNGIYLHCSNHCLAEENMFRIKQNEMENLPTTADTQRTHTKDQRPTTTQLTRTNDLFSSHLSSAQGLTNHKSLCCCSWDSFGRALVLTPARSSPTPQSISESESKSAQQNICQNNPFKIEVCYTPNSLLSHPPPFAPIYVVLVNVCDALSW